MRTERRQWTTIVGGRIRNGFIEIALVVFSVEYGVDSMNRTIILIFAVIALMVVTFAVTWTAMDDNTVAFGERLDRIEKRLDELERSDVEVISDSVKNGEAFILPSGEKFVHNGKPVTYGGVSGGRVSIHRYGSDLQPPGNKELERICSTSPVPDTGRPAQFTVGDWMIRLHAPNWEESRYTISPVQ